MEKPEQTEQNALVAGYVDTAGSRGLVDTVCFVVFP